MDEVEKQRRWETAPELYQAAATALNPQQYRACADLAYYACFQAMWVALSDPPTGRWQHVGISRQFCHRQWAQPALAPSEVQFPVTLEELYTARDQIHELVIQLQEQYDVLILASAVPQDHPSC